MLFMFCKQDFSLKMFSNSAYRLWETQTREFDISITSLNFV